MSRFSKVRTRAAGRAAVALMGAVALGCAAVAVASDEPVHAVTIGAPGAEPSDERKPAAEFEHAVDEKQLAQGKASAAKAPRSLFRCWQGGRLVFEGRGYGALPESQIAADLKGGEGPSSRVQVLDMNYGLCVLELPK